jgi:predicted translin family RNA/ssDNA-binding protein
MLLDIYIIFRGFTKITNSENKITLGQAIAYLHSGKVNNYTSSGADKEISEYLEILKNRLEKLQSHPDNFYSLICNDPETDYTDLFLSIFLKEDFNKDSFELIKFFNDNIKCFEEYSIVLNDYLKKLEDLK